MNQMEVNELLREKFADPELLKRHLRANWTDGDLVATRIIRREAHYMEGTSHECRALEAEDEVDPKGRPRCTFCEAARRRLGLMCQACRVRVARKHLREAERHLRQMPAP